MEEDFHIDLSLPPSLPKTPRPKRTTSTNTTPSPKTALEDGFVIDLGLPNLPPQRNPHQAIQVIGVGDGGTRAANYMYQLPLSGVDFAVCNTDAQSLCASPIPLRVQLGATGMGAQDDVSMARRMAEESLSSVQQLFLPSTQITFIIAGLGGATGTGAAPLIAHEARQKGILTVGLVTLPFRYETTTIIDKALNGIAHLAPEVDALVVINNERLGSFYPDFTLPQALEKANEKLAETVQIVSEVFQMRGIINSDFEDVRQVLHNGGVSIFSSGTASGEGRITQALTRALASPLVDHLNIYNAKKVLFLLSFPEIEGTLTVREMKEINRFTESFQDSLNVDIKLGLYPTPLLHEQVKVSLIASGFGIDVIPGMRERQSEQERAQAQQRIAQQAELQRRRAYFYGDKAFATTTAALTYAVQLFSPTDLDNEQLVQWVDEHPTIQRKTQI